MAQLLEAAFRDAFMPEFMSSLSLSGVDGTLATRFRDEDLAYMLNRKGRRLIVVIQQNGQRVAKGADIQNEILRWAIVTLPH